MRRPFALAVAITLLAAAAAPAKTVDYRNIVSPSKQIRCHAVLPVAGGGIECSAPYLPRIGELDPYYALRKRGKAISSERGDYSGYTTPRRTLNYGDTWKRPGIRCTMRTSGLTCRNLDGHGFRIAKGNLRRF